MNDNNGKNQKIELSDILFKEIDLIQTIIQRMANNSFLIKGWTLTLVVGSLLLNSEKNQFFLTLIPIISFWILDAYYLRMERIYRKMYEWVIDNRMKDDSKLFDLKPSRFEKNVSCLLRTMYSITLITFYGSIGILTLVYCLI
jgi:hypothetical protein